MSDLRLTPTPDGGELSYTRAGDFDKSSGLFNAVYLSLFIGDHWANADREPEDRYRSKIPEIMTRTLTLQTRLDIEAEAEKALEWLVTRGIADSVSADAVIETAGRIALSVTINQASGETTLAYSLNWDAQEIELR